MGDPETVVCLPTGSLVELYVPATGYGQTMLGIRLDREGRPVSCVVARGPDVEMPPSQSNPHRVKHGHRDTEDGA